MGKVRQKLAKRKKIKYLKKKSFISKYAQDRIDEVTRQGQGSQKKSKIRDNAQALQRHRLLLQYMLDETDKNVARLTEI